MNKKQKKDRPLRQTPRFNVINWILLLVGVVVISLGFYFLSRESLTLAPILLVLGYCVLIPVALLLRIGGKSTHA